MRHRSTALAAHLTTAAVWAVALCPAFFAVVMEDRSQSSPGTVQGLDFTPVQAALAPWQVRAADLYELVTIALLISVSMCSLIKPRQSTQTAGAALAAACIGMYAGPVLSALFGGHGGAGNWRLYAGPLTVAALYAAPAIPPIQLMRQLRTVLRVYTWGSLCALAVAPDWAFVISPIMNFRLPGLGSSRLIGLTDHPILLGVLAAAALVMELAPLHRPRLWPLHSIAAATVLILAQSRTAWMAALLGILCLHRPGLQARVHPLLRRGLVLGLVICATILVPSLMERIGRIMSDREVSSLHGRTYIWGIAMRAFRSNIVWGYGPALFSDPSSPVHGAYGHAHSQLYQTLATSGLVGVVGLLLFLAVLVVAAARTGRSSAGLSWSLLAITLITCVTEAPLRSNAFSPYLVLVLLDITVLLSMSRSIQAEPGPAATQFFPGTAGGRSSRTAANSSFASGCSSTSRLGSAG